MNPAAGTSAVWKYNPESFRDYCLNDDPGRRDGLWSDIASISVMGVKPREKNAIKTVNQFLVWVRIHRLQPNPLGSGGR